MGKMMRLITVVGILALSCGVQAQSDPNVGTWKLNLAKSTDNVQVYDKQ